ncbi:MAG: radical SAM protein [Planctomycetota bacterium]
MPDRPYLFHDLTIALCSTCLTRVEAKVVEQDGRIYMHKRCPTHGFEKVLISSDAEYWKRSRQTIKAGQMPLKFNTPIKYGCPYDCGLCPDHEQHSCLTLIEVTDGCNLRCPICYADSGPERVESHRSLEVIEGMLDAVVRNEGEPDVVQISGGEPTIHPRFWDILDAAKARPIKHLMVNSNGVLIASKPDFAKRLAEYMPGFEIYLQWDSFKPDALRELRGQDLADVRMRALENLNDAGVSTTLVSTLKRGLNDDEIGKTIDFALQQPCVRGVSFQPVQDAGRTEQFDHAKDRLTLADVRTGILEQTDVFEPNDVIPVPCHPDCLAMAYALKVGGCVTPLTGLIDPQTLLQDEGSTIIYEKNPRLRDELLKLFSTAASPTGSATSLKQLLCCLPLAAVPGDIGYENVFRVIIMKFMDAHDMDIRSVKKTCVHIAQPDGKIIPFDTFNLLYRDRAAQRLAELRGERRGENPRSLAVLR